MSNFQKNKIMVGFKRGMVTHTHSNRGVHSFRNDPDKAHQTCTRCGCRKVDTYSNKEVKHTFTYFDRNGNKLSEIPKECKGLWDLLNEED